MGQAGFTYYLTFTAHPRLQTNAHDKGHMPCVSLWYAADYIQPYVDLFSQYLSSESLSKTHGSHSATSRSDRQFKHVSWCSPYERHSILCHTCIGGATNTKPTYHVANDEQEELRFGAGPHLLDLGDCLYAPNCFRDAKGRNVMLAWLQELRKGGGFDYAGCISLPRILIYKGMLIGPPASTLLSCLS